jgi:hypothetical protein
MIFWKCVFSLNFLTTTTYTFCELHVEFVVFIRIIGPNNFTTKNSKVKEIPQGRVCSEVEEVFGVCLKGGLLTV